MRYFLNYTSDTDVEITIIINYNDPDVPDQDRLTKGGWNDNDINNVACSNVVTRSKLKPRVVKYKIDDKFVNVVCKTKTVYENLINDGLDNVKGYKGEQTTDCTVLNVK